MDDYTFAAGVGATSWAGFRWLSGWARQREERLAAVEAKSDSLATECQGLRDQLSQFRVHESKLLEKISHLERSLAACQAQLEATTAKLSDALEQISRHRARSLARRAWDYLCG